MPFLAHLALPKWAYIIMIHDFITIWDRDLGFVGMCSVCVCSSCPEYWFHKLYILQIYHIIPLIDAHEIFRQYLLTSSYFAQILKIAFLSTSLNLESQYLSQLWTQFGPSSSQEIVYLVNIGLKLKMFQTFYILKFTFSMKSTRFHNEIPWISWNLLDFIWNPPDFMKFEIWQISLPWNLVDFTDWHH